VNTRIHILPFVVLAIVALIALPQQASANHSWGNYHWARTSNPFNLKLGDNLSSTWKPYLATTSSDWSRSSVLDTTVVAGQSRGKCRPTAGRVEVCNGAYGNNGWLGVAQIWVSGSHITQATTKVNDTYFNTPTYNTPAWRNLVMCQEVAHDFGLDHQDENFDNPNLGTCMDYTSDPSSNQHPNAHDYQQIETIYSHLDSTSTVSQTPAEISNKDLHEKGEWGKLLKRHGKSDVYERDFGGGHKVFTFVFWA
jgi:hypothetical protein